MLKLKDIKKSYTEPDGGRLPILQVDSYELAKGEQAVLVGKSGGGKTTLLHVVAGISRPDSGVVQIANVDIAKLAESSRDRFRAEKIGYVFQTFNLMTGFSALENVLLGGTFARGRKNVARAKDLLDRVGLGKRLSHKPHQLSVGEQQRVAVARALANNPVLLLADEPTANVDPSNQQNIVDLIRNTCRDEDVTLLMVTHAKDVAEQFDRVDQLSEIDRLAKPVAA